MFARTRITLILLLVTTVPSQAAPIRVGVNISGWNVQTPSNPGGYTEHPFAGTIAQADQAGAVLSVNANGKVTKLAPTKNPTDPNGMGVIRYMDWQQTVGSTVDSFDAWPTNNLGPKGGSLQSLIAVANQTKTIPWINVPQPTFKYWDNPSNDRKKSWTYKTVYQMALGLDPSIKEIWIEASNELWNGGDQNQGTQNMFRARTHPKVLAGASDFQKLSEMAALDQIDAMKDARQAAIDAAAVTGRTIKIKGQQPGFIANAQFFIYGQEAINRVHGNTAEIQNIRANSRNVVAPYAPGAPTDIGGVALNDTNAAIMARTKSFVETYYPGWLKGNRDAAKFYGMQGIDMYETMSLSTYLSNGANQLVNMARSTNDQTVRDFHTWFLNYVSDLADGVIDGKNADPAATLIAFGSAGIPFTPQFGQWSVWESYNQTFETDKSIAWTNWINANATNAQVGVPEPSPVMAVVTCAVIWWFVSRGKRHRRLAPKRSSVGFAC